MSSNSGPTTFVSTRRADEVLLEHPVVRAYWRSERRAILLHRFCLSMEQGGEVSLEEAVRSWEGGAASPWRREKMRRDGRQQLLEIERHKYLLSERLGHDVGWEWAAKDWIENHAEKWREWWERQPEAAGEV